MGETLLITGATGNVGQETLKSLLTMNTDRQVIAAVRHPKNLLELGFEDLSWRKLDFQDPDTFAASVAGVDRLFLVRPPAISNVREFIFPFLDEAQKAGVRHIVFLSLQGVERNRITPHHKIEQYLKQLKVAYTFLRPSFFMQNLTTTHLAEIRDRNELFIPAGRGKTNFIDVRDIGEAAARILTHEGHENKAYELTSRSSLDYYEVAEVLSRTLGRRIKYKHPSWLSFFVRKRREGLKPGHILVMIGLYTLVRLGKADGYSDDLERILGRPPRSFSDFARDHAEMWRC